MSLLKIFEVAGTGMDAQSVRLNLVSSNIANADSVSSSEGATYRARRPVFETVLDAELGEMPSFGVRVSGVVEDGSPLRKEYSPGHPAAGADGYIFRPNVSVVEEMADMISAS